MGETANTGGKGDADASNTPQQPGAQPASETDASERPGSSPESVKIERVDLSRPRQTAAPKAVAPAAFAKAAEDPTAVFQRAQDDIAHILDEVKLPERNAPAIKAQAKVYDTSLATDPAKMAAEQAKRQ
ncbi:MAG TPA: hypothetical protein VNM40_01830, partial [Candidatus Paceibacterota bacterium]|nr:hypothetical protein [Candidatus Paceibacterota bacterium]